MDKSHFEVPHLALLAEHLGMALAGAKNEEEVFRTSCRVLGESPDSAAAVLFSTKKDGKYRVAYTSATSSALEHIEQITGITLNFFRVDSASSPTLSKMVNEGNNVFSTTERLVDELFGHPVSSLIKETWVPPKSTFFAGQLSPHAMIIAFGPHYSEKYRSLAAIIVQQISVFLQIVGQKQRYREQGKRLAHEHKLLHALMENIPDHIYFKDRQSRFIRCNRAQAQLAGLSDPRELVGKTDFDFFPEEMASLYREAEKKLLTTGKPIVDQEEPVKRADGEELWFSTTKVPIFNAEGTIDGLVGIGRDITRRKKTEEEKTLLEEQLAQAQKLESLGQLAGGIAHDFNNMLGAISGYANMIRRRIGDKDPHIYDNARVIIQASRRAADLTGKLLAFARKGKYQVVVVDVHDTIQEVIKLLAHTIDRNISIRQQLSAHPPTVMGDRTQLQNVILNLAVNARDAMPKGGELSFSTEVVTITDTTLSAHPHLAATGEYIVLSVADTGTGMDEETKARIFEPFFTTKEKGHGTGLGLASVYGTVKNHQGAIEVTSQPGKGTRFDVYLPLVESEQQERLLEETYLKRGSGTILVVDDEELIRGVAKEIIGHLGYKVVTCNDGVEAVEYYRKNMTSIDLLIIDMIMPRMGGADCVNKIRAINPDARIIISTGYSLIRDTQKVMAKGVDGFIEKPFEEQELSELIAQVMKR